MLLGFVRVNCRGIQQLAGGVHHGHFAARAETRVQPQNRMPRQRRLQQQRPQIGRKNVNCVQTGHLSQIAPHIPLNGGQQEPLCAVFHRLLKVGVVR